MDGDNNIYQPALIEGILPRFGPGFLKDHAGKILTDPKIAIVELVANCWDAGADLVDITWPENFGETISISDNGIGMTYDEFISRWYELSYNRRDEQGPDVIFPSGSGRSSRKAFGSNGKGRHGMFCFSAEYQVETTKGGERCSFRVKRSSNIRMPFVIELLDRHPELGNGFALSTRLDNGYLTITELTELIGSKFVADPSFRIRVNGSFVELTDLEHLSEVYDLSIEGLGTVKIRHFDTRKTGRTSKQHGVAWWVNKRLVGEASWRGFDESPYLDARKSEAKRHTFVVEADILQDSVEDDWDSFKDTDEFERVSVSVKEFILGKLQELFSDIQKTRKIEAITLNRAEVRGLSPESRKMLGTFVEEIQARSPTITQRDLNATVEIFAKLEKSRSQYTLLEQLAKLSPDDLDGLSNLLSEWTLSEAKLVLGVLGQRLKLIETLEKLVENPTTDELHEIHPLFESGLWIFGPEYESIDFISNRSLITVIRELLHDKVVDLAAPRKRPDIVALPDSTISIYSADSFDERSEVNGIAKVLIVELKRGGFTITRNERRQAQDYASELRKSGKIGRSTSIVGFVLGAQIDNDAIDPVKEGETTIHPCPYNVILRQAHARTFNLQQKISQLRAEKGLDVQDTDMDIETIISQPEQPVLIPDSEGSI